MTAHATVEERQRCLDAGMNDHISKPIDPDALYATLARWVKSPPPGVRPPAGRRARRRTLPRDRRLDTAAGLKRVAGNRRST